MRKNEFYLGDIELDNIFQRPGYLGSIEGLAEWAYNIHRNHPDSNLKIYAKKVVYTNEGPTPIEIPSAFPSEIKEAQELAEQGNVAVLWLLATLDLIQSSSPNTQ